MAKKHSQNAGFRQMYLEKLPRKWKYKVHDNLFTTRVGEIKPTCWVFMTPGDTIQDRVAHYSRLAPLQSPIYSRVDHKMRAFVVPLRKLQPDFDKFVSSPPSDEMKMVHTTVADIFNAFYNIGYFTAFSAGTLEDFLGVAPVMDNFYNYINYLNDNTWVYRSIVESEFQVWSRLYYNGLVGNLPQMQSILVQIGLSSSFAGDVELFAQHTGSQTVNLLPVLAYHKIYDDWLRDGRLEPDVSEQIYDQIDSLSGYPLVSAADTITVTDINGATTSVNLIRFLFTERFANYPKDYFTTVGDGAQLGPQLSIGPQRLEIYGSVNANVFGVDRQTVIGHPSVNAGGDPAIDRQRQYNVAHYVDAAGLPTSGNSTVGDIWAEVNQADAITPTKLRYQMALQRFVERANVSMGDKNHRYNEFVFGEYGIRIPDPYLLRSVLIGASSHPMIVDEVLTQADGESNGVSSNVGDFVGRGHYRGSSRSIRGYVREHCLYMTIEYDVPQQYYWQGMRRDLSRLDNLAFPHPIFQQVGQEIVDKKELFFGVDGADPLGYQYRYAFDQIALDEVHGNFRTDLSFWRTGRNMVHDEDITSSFLRIRPTDSNRIFAYTDSRNMPLYVFSRHYMWHKMPLSNNVGDGRIG